MIFCPFQGGRNDIFAYTDGFNTRPRKFDCVIQQRSRLHAEVLEREGGSGWRGWRGLDRLRNRVDEGVVVVVVIILKEVSADVYMHQI